MRSLVKRNAQPNFLKLGKRGEKAALKYLKRLGYKKLSSNFHAERGEIDLVMLDGDRTVFIEVKTRTLDEHNYKKYGSASNAVDREKRKHFLYAVKIYNKQHPSSNRCRIDVIEVYYPKKIGLFTKPELRHIKSAFGADRDR